MKYQYTATSADVLYVDDLEIKTGLNAGLNAKLYFTDGTSKEALISKIDGYSVKTTTLAAGDDNKVYVSAGSQVWADDSTNGATNSKKVGTNNLKDTIYTFTTDGDKYEIKTISNNNKAGFKGQDTVSKYKSETLTLTSGTAKIADTAVIFVEGTDDVKVLSGATINAWGDQEVTVTSGRILYSEANGFKYAQVGAMVLSVEIPDADGDTAYGYVTADPYLIKEDGTNYIQYTLWTADGEKVVREKVSSTAIEKGDFVSYNVGDGTTVKEVAEALTAGAVTAYAGGEDINMVQADNSAISSFANKMADDATVVYVNTADTKGVDGGKIRTASKDSNDKYIANVMYKLDSENKVEVLFVDVNNDLEAVDNPVVAEEKAVAADIGVLKALFDKNSGENDGSSAAKPWVKNATVNAESSNATINLISSGVTAQNGSTIAVLLENAGQSNINSVEISSGALVGKGSGITNGTVIVKFTVTNGSASATAYAQFTTAANS